MGVFQLKTVANFLNEHLLLLTTFRLVGTGGKRSKTSSSFLMGGQRGKGAIKLIIQDLCD